MHRPLAKFLKDPLMHFLVMGAGLFVLYSAINGSVNEPAGRIVIDENHALRLAEQFKRTWMRSPTRQELQALVEDYVKEEILYREALSLGLDQDDLVIRRRLRQKMEFINATWTNTIGAPELITVWQDPEFDPAQRAFYYARVIEIPTPRWTAYEAERYGITMPPEVPMITQERAYTSPIWYTPES